MASTRSHDLLNLIPFLTCDGALSDTLAEVEMEENSELIDSYVLQFGDSDLHKRYSYQMMP